ncbi:MAG: Periplasmic solute binding protein [Verrucomicrobiales bacterium]|nr:Periplasmic solute binding protein [Verrucomicrobiales bacterium]
MKQFLLSLNIGLLTLAAIGAQAKLNVVVTTADLGAIAREIGGDKIDVTTIAKPTEDPHFVDAKPSFYVKLNHADVLIEGGAELEIGWLGPLLEGARNAKLEAGKPGHILAVDGVSLVEVPSSLDRSKGDIHAAGNPHYMTDPVNGKIVADHLANAFCQLDAKNCDSFKANLKKFQERMDSKLAEWGKLLAPYKGKDVISYHNSWPYFAHRFGLKMDLFLEPKPGIPPTPSHLAEVITKMKAEDAKVIIVEPFLNRKTAEAVANHTGAQVVDAPPFPKDNESYIDWMDTLIKSLANGFAGKK